MVSSLHIIQETSNQRKKLKQSKNRKKAWRKHIDLTDIENALEEKDLDERTGVLGEETSNILYLDTGCASDDDADNATKTTPLPVKLEYTIDSNTGLKATNKKKSGKLIHSQRFLAGLPGAVGPFKGKLRTRPIDELDHRAALEVRSAGNARNAARAIVKEKKRFISTKKSKLSFKATNRMSFDKDLWDNGPEPSIAGGYVKEALDRTRLLMGTRPVNNRGSKRHASKILGVPLPHAGLSYNPDLKSHQQLLKKAVKREVGRAANAQKTVKTQTTEFPAGAIWVNALQCISDMNSDNCATKEPAETNKTKSGKKKASSDENGDGEEEEAPPPPVSTKDRRTHRQRLRELRYKKQLHTDAVAKAKRKMEAEISRVKEFNREMDDVEVDLKERARKRSRVQSMRPYKPVKHFIEGDVEVALGDELSGSLRLVKPTGNMVTDRIQHFYRRGMLPTHGKARKYSSMEKHNSMARRYKKKTIEKFTHDQMTMEKAPKKLGEEVPKKLGREKAPKQLGRGKASRKLAKEKAAKKSKK